MKKIAIFTGALATALSLVVGIPKTYAEYEYYNGTDPAASGCANTAITVDTVYIGPTGKKAKLELRYSTYCRTAWARLTLPEPAGSSTGTDGSAYIVREQDELRYKCTVPTGGYQCYTPQVNDRGYTSYADAYLGIDNVYYSGWTDSY